MAIPAGNAATTPIEVVRANGICFFTMRGDPYTHSFLFHYVNLSPKVIQTVTLGGTLFTPLGPLPFPNREYTVCSGESVDDVVSGGYGCTFSFYVVVKVQTKIIYQTVATEVDIPPPPLPVKVLPP